MKKYWFEFEFHDDDIPPGTAIGCGVTAFDYNDAIGLLSRLVFKQAPLPAIVKMIEDVDVSTLDTGHVMPNMAPPHIRGIWFPPGYQQA